jgi:hypothetical protein
MTTRRIVRSAAWVPLYAVTVGAACADVQVLSHGSLRVEIETATNRHMQEFGPRFDRTAVVRSVTVDGVELLGPWGLSDEFGLYGDGVLGYEAADIGARFVKIGVGTLLRDTSASYHFAHPYPVSELFPVVLETAGQELSVSQDSDPALPHRYHYRKTYTVGEGNVLTISYHLANTGEAPWTFEHYNHHWFRLGEMAPGPAYRVASGFKLPDAETAFLLEPNALHMAAPLRDGGAAYYGSDLDSASVSENTVALSVDGSTIVHYAGSFAPARFAVYASAEGFCPEIFKRSALQPGQSASWSATYRFSAPEHPRPAGR